MRLRFKGPGEMCEAFGRVFVADEWEEAGGLPPEDARTLSLNPTFEVERGEGEGAGAPPRRSGARGAGAGR